MKPLFDSEQFSFIGSSDDHILVHCRKCGDQAKVDVESNPGGNAVLRATCPQCKNRRNFTFADPVKIAASGV